MDERLWINALANRCQVVVGDVLLLTSSEWLADLAQLLDDVPLSLPAPERFIVKGLIAEVVRGVARTSAINGSQIQPTLSEFLSAQRWPDAQRARMNCANVIASAQSEIVGSDSDRSFDVRVGAALRIIVERHTDAGLTLDRVARDVAVSSWHLSRLLKRHTGQTFEAHLHNKRILHAQSLLRGKDLSIKEIADAVGYSSTTQLDRHFKRNCNITPKVFRKVSRG